MAPTPLLDRVDPLPMPVPRGRGSWIITAAALCACVGVGVVLMTASPSQARAALHAVSGRFPQLFAGEWTAARGVVALLWIFVAMIAVVVVHECGHVAAGLLVGFRFGTIAIGPIKLDDRFRVSIHRGALAWSGGWVHVLPVVRTGLRWRAAFLVAGGPLASLIAGVIALRIAGGGPGSIVFVAGCLGSIVDLLPVRAGTVALDGFRLVRLYRDDAWSRRWLALLIVGADFRNGVAPDELPPAVIDTLVALQDDSADTSIAHAIAYGASFYSGDDERSAEHLDTALRFSGHVAPSFLAALMSDAAVFQARRRHRPDLALAWRNELANAAPWLRMRAEAAVLQAQGQTAAAAARLDDCERAIAGLPMPSEAQRQMAIRLLGRWKAELTGVS